jgi:hypothetical protein
MHQSIVLNPATSFIVPQLADCHIILPHTPHATVIRATSQMSLADFNDLPPEIVGEKFGGVVKREGGGVSS